MKFNKKVLMLALSLICLSGFAQETEFNYRRKINGVSDQKWYAIALPGNLFRHCQQDFRDLRIYELNNADTIEIQYLLDILDTEINHQNVTLDAINQSSNGNEYYITFSNAGYKVNYLSLKFQESNYFATVMIEGSNDRKKWFELAKDEKIFSVNNEREQYESSLINFPLTDYNYLRLKISSADKLTFSSASFRLDEIKPGSFDNIPASFTTTTDKKSKRTVVDVKLDDYRPVSNIMLDIDTQNDFYRQLSVEALIDSTKTERGWIKNYQMISGNLITSFKPNQFSIPFTLTSRLRLTIENYDNPSLAISAVKLNGAKVQLRAKLKSENSYLHYGNARASKPTYDIAHFAEKVPAQAEELTLGVEENIGQSPTPMSAIFENKLWLWGILISVIALLGFFTLRMMKSQG